MSEDEFVEGLYPELLAGVLHRDLQRGDVFVRKDGTGVRVVAVKGDQTTYEDVAKDDVDKLRSQIESRPA